jgi:hypothetical protein
MAKSYLLMVGLLCPAVALSSHRSVAPSATASGVMARVALSQDRSNKLRADYVYQQHVQSIARKTNGHITCQETADYQVIPFANATKKELKAITVQFRRKGRNVVLHAKPKDNIPIDCAVVDSFTEDLLNGKTRDSVDKDLFPLTSAEQKKYAFRLIDEEALDGRRVYRIAFRPRDKKNFTWKGQAYIDAQDFEPIDIYTRMARRLPLAVRAFLVALPGLGFNIQYQRQPGGAWFPSTFGTEFRMRLLMFYRRIYTVSVRNSGFERARVKSRMKYIGPAAATAPSNLPHHRTD